MSQAITDVIAERKRQIEVEGWTAEHDSQYKSAELTAAAVTYATIAGVAVQLEAEDGIDIYSLPGRLIQGAVLSEGEVPLPWPWSPEWLKPKSVRQDLVRAAALIIAQIELLDSQKSEVHNERDITTS